MKNPETNDLKHQISQLDIEVKRICSADENEPLLDGIINPSEYITAPVKILWILKEAYDEFDVNGNPVSSGWSYRDALNQNLSDFKSIKTWQRIAYTSYGIIENMEYDDMDDIKNETDVDDKVFAAIKKVAFININKLPARTSSPFNDVKDAYQKFRDVLLHQISVFNPQIIIGGGTLTHFKNDLGLEPFLREGHNLKYYLKSDTLFIDAYHPSFPKGPSQVEEYVNDIVRVVNEAKVIVAS